MFGVSTYCLHDLPLSSALERITSITGLVEVIDEGFHYLETTEPLESYSARFSIHAPCRGVNISSLLEPIRRASVEVIGQCFSVASAVNANVVVHPGYFAWPEERAKAEKQLKRSLSEITTLAKEYSLSYFIENMGNWEYFFIRTPDELTLIGNEKFALDVGHAHQNHCLFEFLRYPARHFHLHDNNGKDDSHVAVGEGTIDFAAVMKAVRASGVTPIIEVSTFDGVIKSMDQLKAF
jgi:sugar phosphate isomerase/epimerase